MREEDRSEKGAESAASGNFSRLSFFKVVATGCTPANKAHDANLFSPIADRLLSKLSASATSCLWTTALESPRHLPIRPVHLPSDRCMALATLKQKVEFAGSL